MEVLRPQTRWPPDMAATFAELKERFDKKAQTSQQPVSSIYISPNGMEDTISEGVGDLPGYLAAQEKELSRTPWLCPQPGVEFFQDLHIQVRVSSERREPWQDRERERRRRAGGLIVEDEERRRSAYRHPADEAQFAEKKPAQPPLPWWDPTAPAHSARRRYPWAVLLGDPGIGKTTLLRYEGWLTAREQAEGLRNGTIEIKGAVLPLYVKLADLAKGVTQNRDMVETLADLVTDPRRGGLIVSPPLGQLLRRKLRNGQVVLLLDALDELPNESYDALVGWLRAWVRDHRPQRLYLTSRLAGYRSLPLDLMVGGGPGAGRAELELVAFTPAEIHQYISAYIGDAINPATSHRLDDELWCQLEQNPPMLGLSQTPLLLTLICLAFAHAGQGRKLQLPVTRCELYAECLEGRAPRPLASCPQGGMGVRPHAEAGG